MFLKTPLLHLFAAILDFFTLWYDQKYVNVRFFDDELDYPFRNRILFLTMWTLALQGVYMSVALLNDIIGTNEASPKKPPAIRKIKDAMFSLAYPVATYVTIAFWGIYVIHKDLIFPEHIEKAYPSWVNHVMHTFVSVFINIEMFISNIKYPSNKVNISLFHIYILSYIAWVFIVYGQTGIWVYPVLSYLSWPARLFFISGSVVVGNVFNLFGKILNRKLSSRKVKSK